MKYLDEYRDARIARALAAEIKRRSSRPWVLMEICGGQTHTLMRYGIDELVHGSVELVHGPGCPVCVTPLEIIDRAINLARRPDVTLVSYDAFVSDPRTTMERLCAFVGFPYSAQLVAHVEQRHPRELQPLAIDGRLRTACDEMQARLDGARAPGGV